MDHGGKRSCKHDKCDKWSKSGGFCRDHGGGKRKRCSQSQRTLRNDDSALDIDDDDDDDEEDDVDERWRWLPSCTVTFRSDQSIYTPK